MNKITKYFSAIIKETRNNLNESGSVFGKRFGVSHASVSDWERGISEAPYRVIFFCLDVSENSLSLCPKCNCMTKKVCGKCSAYELKKQRQQILEEVEELINDTNPVSVYLYDDSFFDSLSNKEASYHGQIAYIQKLRQKLALLKKKGEG